MRVRGPGLIRGNLSPIVASPKKNDLSLSVVIALIPPVIRGYWLRYGLIARSGTLGRIRTRDPLVRSQVLYPLSYEREKGFRGSWLG